MNAAVGLFEREIEPFFVQLPAAALRRLELRLGRERESGELWDACIQYGAPFGPLFSLFDYWCDELDLRAAAGAVNRLPLFRVGPSGRSLCFVHQRSSAPTARPLLLLHGFFGSPAEFGQLFESLAPSFHVVCPGLPGFGLSQTNGEPSLSNVASSCARLMHALGYERYAVHGSDLGASVAAELARLEPGRVAALHVTGIVGLPSADPHELATLTSEEKSRLASYCELQDLWSHAFPKTAAELLALALNQFAESASAAEIVRYRDPLLLSLSLSLLAGDDEFRAALAAAARAPLSLRSETPAYVCDFPLASPSLRRFAESRQRIAEWCEYERGGCLPALEQPQILLRSLRQVWREVS